MNGHERRELEATRDQKRGKAPNVTHAVALLMSGEGAFGAALKNAEIQRATGISPRITQLACSKPPEDHARWTLRLLASHLVEIEVIKGISHQSVSTVLKSKLKPWRQGCRCIPPRQNAAFVAAMEDVHEVNSRAPRHDRPVACLDEFANNFTAFPWD